MLVSTGSAHCESTAERALVSDEPPRNAAAVAAIGPWVASIPLLRVVLFGGR